MASPAHEEAEQKAAEGQEQQDEANPPGRQHLELACELGGMASKLPEMPNAGAATVRVGCAADGAAGTSDGLAAAASLPSVAQPVSASAAARARRRLAEPRAKAQAQLAATMRR